jgi:hypothetical protein
MALLDVRTPAVKRFLPQFYVPSHERRFLIATDIQDNCNYKLDHVDHIYTDLFVLLLSFSNYTSV